MRAAPRDADGVIRPCLRPWRNALGLSVIGQAGHGWVVCDRDQRAKV